MALVDRFFVTDRVAIVSGSGRGIGAACARTLAEAGADVVLVARTKADLDAVAAQVTQPGIRVNAVAPGSTWTPALERYYTAEELEAKIARTPMRRLARPRISRWPCCSSPRRLPAT